MKNCEITGYGVYLPSQKVNFGDQTRYHVEDGVSQLDMLSHAGRLALENAAIDSDDLDCLIVAAAVGSQPIPATAALLQEQIAPEAEAAAFDINSTCTSFITALDYAARLVDDGKYDNVLIASGDVGTRFINPNQPESYELFSDAGVAVVVSKTEDKEKGMVDSDQRTWPKHAHDTEIRGGLTAQPPEFYTDNPEDYLFDMNGKRALIAMGRVLPDFYSNFMEESKIELDDVKLVIPHQASRALPIVMNLLGIPEHKYANHVQDYGNMVSASVPFILAKKIGDGVLSSGDLVLLCGTAAGLTANVLAFRL